VEYRRTAVIKLDTPDGADPLLRESVEQFKHCANTASEWCWHGDDGYHVISKAKAERALYDRLRDETDLTANFVQKGIRRAVEAVKSGVERLKRGENTSKPYFSADSAVYDKRSAIFHRDHVSLSTVDGRVECEYILPDDSKTPPTKYVSDEDF
jgi:putative transposase